MKYWNKTAIAAMLLAIGAVFALATNARAQEIDMQAQAFAYRNAPYADAAPRATVRYTKRVTRKVIRQFHPRQIKKNTEDVIRAPFEGVDRAGQWLLKRTGTNATPFTCLHCGRGQRMAAIAGGFRDCAGGDHVLGWTHPSCSTPAKAGEMNALRITYYRGGRGHIEKVVGRCNNPHAPIKVVDQNGPGGLGSVRCVPVGAYAYRHLIPLKPGEAVKVHYMQPDPCRGRGPARYARRSAGL